MPSCIRTPRIWAPCTALPAPLASSTVAERQHKLLSDWQYLELHNPIAVFYDT
jgi:hypothetical protein